MTAFTLAPPGPPAPCGYPGCSLAAFHDGDHDLPPPARPAPGKAWEDVRRCLICGTPFVVYGERIPGAARLCGSQACLVEQVRRESWGAVEPLRCSCPQRPYPHELSVHTKIRHERPGTYLLYEDLSVRFAPEGLRWPWSLNLSSRVEPSTERQMGG
jgi:hypothetical protein